MCTYEEKGVNVNPRFYIGFISSKFLQYLIFYLFGKFKSLNFREFKRNVAVSLTGFKSKKIINNPVPKVGGCESINFLLSKEKMTNLMC